MSLWHIIWRQSEFGEGSNWSVRMGANLCFVLGLGVPSCNHNQNHGTTVLQTVMYSYLCVLGTTSYHRATSGLRDSDAQYLR